LTSKFAPSILILAISVVVLIALLSTVQPSVATTQVAVPQHALNHLAQTTSTNSTAAPTNQTAQWYSFISAPVVAYVKAALAPYIGSPPQLPYSTLFTVGVAVCVSLISATTGKLLVDYEMIRQNMREFQAYQKDLNKAKKDNDQQALSRLMKKQQAMMKLQGRASMEQMKVTAVTFIPFLILWYTLSAVLGSVVVANAPWPVLQPFLNTRLVFWQWYLLSNFAISLPMYKIFGIGMTDN
jgi:uncharacterized membrane protein (DUF106 family)